MTPTKETYLFTLIWVHFNQTEEHTDKIRVTINSDQPITDGTDRAWELLDEKYPDANIEPLDSDFEDIWPVKSSTEIEPGDRVVTRTRSTGKRRTRTVESVRPPLDERRAAKGTHLPIVIVFTDGTDLATNPLRGFEVETA